MEHRNKALPRQESLISSPSITPLCSSLNNMLELPESPTNKKQVRFSENIEKIESQSTIEECSDCFSSDTDENSYNPYLTGRQLFKTPFLTISRNSGFDSCGDSVKVQNPDEYRCSRKRAWCIRLGLAVISILLGYGFVWYIFVITNGRKNR